MTASVISLRNLDINKTDASNTVNRQEQSGWEHIYTPPGSDRNAAIYRIISPLERVDSMANDFTREELDAKIRATAAETDTKIARIEGKIDTAFAALGGKLDTVNQRLADQTKDRNLVIGTIVVSAISVAVLIIGLATYGDALFGRGMNVRDVVQAVVKEQQQIQVQPSPPTQPKR